MVQKQATCFKILVPPKHPDCRAVLDLGSSTVVIMKKPRHRENWLLGLVKCFSCSKASHFSAYQVRSTCTHHTDISICLLTCLIIGMTQLHLPECMLQFCQWWTEQIIKIKHRVFSFLDVLFHICHL